MLGDAEVAGALERLAALLEIRGDNPFRVRAYRTAVAQIENLGEPLRDLLARGELRLVPGFGEAIAAKIEELLTTGRLAALERVEAEVPPSLLEVRGLPGVGPRTAATLWREVGITTVDELEAAARAGRLRGLPRLGPRTAEAILAAIEARQPEEAGV